jgi:hypothetical protein
VNGIRVNTRDEHGVKQPLDYGTAKALAEAGSKLYEHFARQQVEKKLIRIGPGDITGDDAASPQTLVSRVRAFLRYNQHGVFAGREGGTEVKIRDATAMTLPGRDFGLCVQVDDGTGEWFNPLWVESRPDEPAQPEPESAPPAPAPAAPG